MNRTVLITGASSGIGAATVRHFAADGWNVTATMRNPGGVHFADDSILVTRLDVQDPDTVEHALVQTLERFGAVDVVVNNAGYGQYGVFEAIDPADVQRQFAVNVFGPMNVIRAALPHLRGRPSATIINVSSGGGLYGLPMTSVYCASKFALDGFTEALSYELRGVGISVKLVIPHGGVANTNFSSGTSMPPIPDTYAEYATASWSAAADRPAPEPVAATAVAATIHGAATDGTDTLRYLVGNDTRGLIEAWASPWPERERRLAQLLA
jgi:NAD(P)-dependent dehydrogenase (short-subunit alcohol dehydrogenase family)